MCSLQSVKLFVQQRLTAAVEEIFGHLDKTITEYEEEIHRRLLQGAELRAEDVQQLLEGKEEAPPQQQEWSSGLDQEEPDPPHIKEEQEELWTSQEGEQLQGPEEADIIRFTYIPVPREDDEEKPQSSQLQRAEEPPAGSSTEPMKTAGDEDDSGGSEPARNFDPDSYLQPVSEEETWMESGDPLSGLKALNNNIVNDNIVHRLLESEEDCTDGTKSYACPHCDKSFHRRETLNRHMRCHTGEKPYSCSVCNGKFRWRADFVAHLRIHTGEKPFMCSVCGKCFIKHGTLTRHMRTHTGERPHVCSVCGHGFHRKEDLTKHTRTHTGEKPFSCSVCNRQFSRLFRVKNHKCVVESGDT
ncbi:zinc finger protein 771-like [Scomber scombrus]|uniref:zinc finger protein 771-like n=1 Tax=Scomber scombrus TaxID=13677 RepID=UPI002DDBB8AE|nr:zinc finger protein 771-like [Scomber scombrus]